MAFTLTRERLLLDLYIAFEDAARHKRKMAYVQKFERHLKHNLDTQQEYNEEQKTYIRELKEDRQHLREERDELRNRLDKCDEDIRDLKRDVARNGRMVDCMRPLLCGREGCATRVPVTISQDGEISKNDQ